MLLKLLFKKIDLTRVLQEEKLALTREIDLQKQLSH